MSNISKRFGPVAALNDVHLTVYPGTIHAVVGENGAGKTTLLKVLFGAHQADSGEIKISGKKIAFRKSSEAIKSGIGMVSQHYAIIPELTCLENLILGAEPSYFLDSKSAKVRADSLAQRMNFQFDWDAEARGIGPAACQKLEILKLLWRDSKIMILDEPTAMLSPEDADALYVSLRDLASKGATIIVVTHRLPEVLEHCDHVTVLRGGNYITNLPTAETNSDSLAELIVGRAVPKPSLRQATYDLPTLLEVKKLTVKDNRGFERLKEASLTVKRGEVLGLAGVDGNGQRELVSAIIGKQPVVSGSLLLGDEPITECTTKERLTRGLRIIPEDRHGEGVLEEWSLQENAALGMQGSPPFAKGIWIDPVGKSQAAESIAARFSTKHDSINDLMVGLSGGNQQRFVNGRAIVLSPRLIIAFQPARGLDIDATRNFYEGLYGECEKGAGALVISFDLDELLTYCDRIVVLNVGKVFEPPINKAKDRNYIGHLMVASS